MDSTPYAAQAQILSLAVVAHQNLLRDDGPHRATLRGARDAFAIAAATMAVGHPGQAALDLADRITELLDAGRDNLQTLVDQMPPTRTHGLDWIGPMAFQRRATGVEGIDHDHDDHWGRDHDIRISHRRPHEGTTGLLYAYSRGWDEYTVLGERVSVSTVDAARQAALESYPRMGESAWRLFIDEARLLGRPAVDRGIHTSWLL